MNNEKLLELTNEYIELAEEYINSSALESMKFPKEIALKEESIDAYREYYNALTEFKDMIIEVKKVILSSHLKNKIMLNRSETYYSNFLVVGDKLCLMLTNKMNEVDEAFENFKEHFINTKLEVEETQIKDDFDILNLYVLSIKKGPSKALSENINKAINDLFNASKTEISNYEMKGSRSRLIPYKEDDINIIFSKLNAKYDKTIDFLENVKNLPLTTLIITKNHSPYVYNLNKMYEGNDSITKAPNASEVLTKKTLHQMLILTSINSLKEPSQMIYTDKNTDKAVVFEFLGGKFLRVLTDNYHNIMVSKDKLDDLKTRNTIPALYNKESLNVDILDKNFYSYMEILQGKSTVIKYQPENLKYSTLRYIQNTFKGNTVKDLKFYFMSDEFNNIKFELFNDLTANNTLYSNELHITMTIYSERLAKSIRKHFNDNLYRYFKDMNNFSSTLYSLTNEVFNLIQRDKQLYDTFMRNLKVAYLSNK